MCVCIYIYTFIDADGVFGRVPQSILDDEEGQLITAHENSMDLQNLRRVSENAYKQYLKSRPSPSPESIKRVKNTDFASMAIHPLLGEPVTNCFPFTRPVDGIEFNFIEQNGKTVLSGCKVWLCYWMFSYDYILEVFCVFVCFSILKCFM